MTGSLKLVPPVVLDSSWATFNIKIKRTESVMSYLGGMADMKRPIVNHFLSRLSSLKNQDKIKKHFFFHSDELNSSRPAKKVIRS